ncbi:serine/threonine-protein phosphatase [Candidatus Woesearchaeota archaeon]|nr:serine/threonine-protein phosphatase [Candidatus Woesearchaeota archaeon]
MNEEELDAKVELLVRKSQTGSKLARNELSKVLAPLFDEPTSDDLEKEINATVDYIIHKLVVENYCETNAEGIFHDEYLSYFARSIHAQNSKGGRFYVCGDTHFFHKIHNGRYALGRLDGMHHGVAAGLTVLTATRYLDDFLKRGIYDPKEIAKRISEKMYLIPKKGGSAFTTLFVSILDDSTAHISCVGDGQTLLFQSATGTLTAIKSEGPVIGIAGPQILKTIEYKTEEFELKKGDVLVSYTDGVNERKGFEFQKIEEFVKYHNADIKTTVQNILDYAEGLLPQGGGLADDTTAIGLRILK